MTKYAEEIFEPKRITDNGDWLCTHRESDQRFDYYKQGKGNIKWLNHVKNKIYLFTCDDSFTNEQIANYQKYADAFFMGSAAAAVFLKVCI